MYLLCDGIDLDRVDGRFNLFAHVTIEHAPNWCNAHMSAYDVTFPPISKHKLANCLRNKRSNKYFRNDK